VVERDACSLGFEQVDSDEHVAVLLRTMDATASWDATRELRTFERRELRLADGDRLLDVGCGLGDAAINLGEDLGPGGEVVGTLTLMQWRESCGMAMPSSWTSGMLLSFRRTDAFPVPFMSPEECWSSVPTQRAHITWRVSIRRSA
jgi:hypothetical protein